MTPQAPGGLVGSNMDKLTVARPVIPTRDVRAFPTVIALAVSLAASTADAKPAFPPRTKDNLPNVQSAAAIVVALDDGEVLYEKDADEVRQIASTGKVLVALTAREQGIDLTGETEITQVDRTFSKGGARTRLPVGYSFNNLDLMRAMLIASDNRAPSAIGRAVGKDADAWLEAINAYAKSIGLEHTEFTDPPGLRGNVSTAREMSMALRKALADSVLSEILATKRTIVTSTKPRKRKVSYNNTNRSLRSARYHVLGGKTGYTDAAGYCLVIAAEVDGREVAMVFLGSQGKLTRYGDFNRVVGWLRDGMPNKDKAIAQE